MHIRVTLFLLALSFISSGALALDLPPRPLQPQFTPLHTTTSSNYGDGLFGRPAFRRNVLHDLSFAGSSFVRDALYVYSSPARLNTRSALVLGGILAVGAAVYAADDDIASALHRNEDHWLYDPFRELGEALEPVGRQGTMNKYIFGTAVVSYVVGFERLARMSSEILESYLIAGVPKVAVNRTTGRPRPIDGEAWNHWDFFDKGQSFFSGHASHAFQMARIFSEYVDFLPCQIAFYTAASSIGLQRVSSGWHWASDVWIGSVYGFVVADALLGHHRRSWSVSPISSPGGSAVNVSLRF